MNVHIIPAAARPLSSRWRPSVLVSLTLHGGVLAAVVGGALFLPFTSSGDPREYLQVVLADPQAENPSVVSEVEIAPPERNPFESDPVNPVSSVEEVTGEMVVERLQKDIAEAQSRSAEENLDEFDRLAGRLESVSSEESVDEISTAIRQWTKTAPRAVEPVDPPPAGDFDFSTAQLYDVVLNDEEDSAFPYIAVLLDAEGRTLRQKVNDAEGRVAFETFQKIKRFPLAQRLYRQLVMGMLDSIVKTAQDGTKHAREIPADTAEPSEGLSPPAVE